MEAGLNLTLKDNTTGTLAEVRVLVETPPDGELMELVTELAQLCGRFRTLHWTCEHVATVVFTAPVGFFEKWKETPPPAATDNGPMTKDGSHGH
jgi:hypothetical protein